MAKRPKSKIQRGFVLGYLAIAVMVVATGFALRNVEPISADTTWYQGQDGLKSTVVTPTAVTAEEVPEAIGEPTDTFEWEGCVDGHDIISVAGSAINISHLKWQAIGAHSDCSKLGNTSKTGNFSGNLTGCNKVSLSSKVARGSLTLTKNTPIFTVDLNDNAPSGAAIYKFTLTCTSRASVTPTNSATVTSTNTAKPVAPSCMVGSTAKTVKLLDRDKEIFGANAKAYLVTTTDKKNFRVIIGGTKLSSTATGGQIKLVYGFQNLNTFAVGNDVFGLLRYNYKTDGKAQTADLDFRKKAVAPGAYFSGTKTITVSDFSKAAPTLKMLRSGTAVDCITNPIPLAGISVGTTPTPSATASQQALSYTFKTGFNTIVAPNSTTVQDSRVLDTEPITDMNMYVYDFNRLGQKNWRTTHPNAGANYGLIPQVFDQIGYYVYNPGPELTVNVPLVVKTGAKNVEEKTKMRKGWNLLAVSSETAVKLSEYKLNVTKKGAAASCLEDSCIEQVTLKDLLTGDSQTRRAYRTIYEIKDGNATNADDAFTVVKVDTTNIDSVTLPGKTAFWIYLWD